DQRGMGRIGADYWRVIKDKRGRRRGWAHQLFREGNWGWRGSMNLNLCNPVLAPGPDGPMATNRLVALHEGIQECEARIFIERALTNPRLKRGLGAAFAKQTQGMLDERLLYMFKGMDSLQFLRGGSWRGMGSFRFSPGVAGHAWFLSSGWRARHAKLYAAAAEVARKTGQR
ncbi:unnamed protein product, partial [marine sediment metagenome]